MSDLVHALSVILNKTVTDVTPSFLEEIGRTLFERMRSLEAEVDILRQTRLRKSFREVRVIGYREPRNPHCGSIDPFPGSEKCILYFPLLDTSWSFYDRHALIVEQIPFDDSVIDETVQRLLDEYRPIRYKEEDFILASHDYHKLLTLIPSYLHVSETIMFGDRVVTGQKVE